ncbi:hypothetical protein Q9X95_004604, partial [Vibrio parahaemolyticus]|nr:hypothetical protein [Vibrio parahaemolyticus]
GWINYIREMVPNFPFRKHSNGNKVHLSNALVIFTGAQSHNYEKGLSVYRWAKSPFAVETISLDQLFYTQLRGPYFSENGFSDLFALNPYAIRHYNNTELQKSGVSQELIAIVSGRTKLEQNIVYDHRTNEEVTATLRKALGDIDESELEKQIESNVIDIQNVSETLGRHVEDVGGVGLCFQDLSQTPCSRRSQLRLHCVGCSKAMFCKGNPIAIEAMKKDVVRLKNQLTELYENDNWYKFTNGRLQFKEKTQDMALCSELINIMQLPNYENGNLIRISAIKHRQVHFQIIDIKTHNIIGKPTATLPDISLLLEKKIQEYRPKEENPLKEFFLTHGINLDG